MESTVLLDFEKLKISAFSKYSQLTGNINNVTIGPNSVSFLETTKEVERTVVKPVKKERQESVVRKSPVPVSQLMKDFENQRREKLQDAITDRYRRFDDFSKNGDKEKTCQWLCKQQAFIQSVREEEQKIIEASIIQNDSRIHREKLRRQYQEMQQRKQQYEQQLEKNRERQKELSENLKQIKVLQSEFRSEYQNICSIIKNCVSSEDLKVMLGNNFNLLKLLPQAFEEVLTKCKAHNVDQDLLGKSSELVYQIRGLKIEIESAVEKINKKKEAVKEIQKESVRQELATLNECVSPTNLKKFIEIKSFLTRHSSSFKDLMNDEQLKQFRFDCKKAVNIPVNAISSVSSEHLKDKYLKLFNLLSGKTILVADKQINASRHPQGILFCMDLLAKKFVLQGDLMFSSNPESSFCYASVIISLWNDFPDFGNLLLAHFYTRCPYLVPFYMPKTEDQSNEDYYTSLGYQYIDGQIEKQDKFLKRMTGILRLFFAITIAKPHRGQTKSPYDIKNAWSFLASLLKLQPQLDITATVLYVFLETVGFQMEATYGIIFKRVIITIVNAFMPHLKEIDSGGPVARLEVLLQNYRQKGFFEKPNGILAENFW